MAMTETRPAPEATAEAPPQAVPADPAIAYHPPVELYDLATDPNEWTNLADDPAQATIRADLLARLHAWMRDTDDPLLAGPVTSPSHRRAIDVLISPESSHGTAPA